MLPNVVVSFVTPACLPHSKVSLSLQFDLSQASDMQYMMQVSESEVFCKARKCPSVKKGSKYLYIYTNVFVKAFTPVRESGGRVSKGD